MVLLVFLIFNSMEAVSSSHFDGKKMWSIIFFNNLLSEIFIDRRIALKQ